jgi:hypothetical protein
MEGENMQHHNDKLPEIIVFAGPNGSEISWKRRMGNVSHTSFSIITSILHPKIIKFEK